MIRLEKKALLLGSGFFLCLMLIFGISPAFCVVADADNPQESKGQLEFVIDHAVFWQDPSTAQLDIYYKIRYTELQFLKQKNLYQARFDLSVVIYDDSGTQVIGKHWQHPVNVANLNVVNTSFAYSQVRFQLPPGEYKIKIKIEDLNAQVTGSAEDTITISPFPKEKFALGMIQFAETVESDTVVSAFTKHNFFIAPNPTRSFGESLPVLYFYSELYQSGTSTPYKIEFFVKSTSDSIFYSDTKDITLNTPITPLTGQWEIDGLIDGDYTLLLKATDQNTHQKVEMSRQFRIAWSPVAWGMDFKETVSQILYLATSEEMKAFKKLKNNPQKERVQFMMEFWAKRDPVPSTPQNEFMIEHFRRYKYANEHFADVIPGWRTDMGRIFIKFGEPDEIERHPFNFNSRPYEIWNYYACGFRFIFVDEDGYGRYNLVSPTSEDMYSRDCYGDY